MQLFNQYSYFFLAAILLGLAGFLLRRRLAARTLLAALGGAAVVLGLAWLAVRPPPGVNAEVAQIQAQIGNGTPVLLEFQSQY